MRTYAVVGKYPVYDEDGTITHTDISLNATSGGFDSFTQRVAGNHRNKSDNEVIELAKDAYFKSEYAEKALSESVQEIDNLKVKAKERDQKVKEQKYMDLLPIAKTGDTFQTDDLFVLEDPSHEEVDGEGIKILIQAQKAFTYNGEPISEFMKGGKLELGTATAWPFVGKE